jgi:GNAT superfamily N-acetyltransferase
MDEPAPALLTDLTCAPVSASDFEALASLRVAAMRESLERVGRFDPERSRARLQRSFYPEHSAFVVLNGESIGFYTFRPAENGLHLDHFYLLPEWQGRGLGSRVLRKLLAHADAWQVPVYLGALRESPANRFYQRHGFVVVEESEWDIHYMRTPQPAAPR